MSMTAMANNIDNTPAAMHMITKPYLTTWFIEVNTSCKLWRCTWSVNFPKQLIRCALVVICNNHVSAAPETYLASADREEEAHT